MAYYLESFPVGAFQCNCVLLIQEESRAAMVIDPGDEFEAIQERIVAHDAWISALWHTHAHIDHVGATQALFDEAKSQNEKNGRPAPRVYLHPADEWLYRNIGLQAQFLGLYPFAVPSEYVPIIDRQSYEDFPKTQALHTPGHTPGSCCLLVREKSQIDVPRSYRAGVLASNQDVKQIMLSGDTLFRQSIGRTDLWGGDSTLIVKSIRQRIFSLSDDTVVIPGHGPLTTVEFEKEKNPFVKVG